MTDDLFELGGDDVIGDGGARSSVGRGSAVTDRLDTMFDVLYDSRRRFLLYYLVSVDESVVELEAAADAVADYEAARTEPTDRSSRADINLGLHHNHLPRLAETAILDYDCRQGTIRLTGDDDLQEWVEFARSKELE